jgi:Na+(H+)/acetate symporter ActP
MRDVQHCFTLLLSVLYLVEVVDFVGVLLQLVLGCAYLEGKG